MDQVLLQTRLQNSIRIKICVLDLLWNPEAHGELFCVHEAEADRTTEGDDVIKPGRWREEHAQVRTHPGDRVENVVERLKREKREQRQELEQDCSDNGGRRARLYYLKDKIVLW